MLLVPLYNMKQIITVQKYQVKENAPGGGLSINNVKDFSPIGSLRRDWLQKILCTWLLEIWVETGAMLTVLEGFHHQVDRKITVKKALNAGDGRWEWSPVEEDLEMTGLWPIK